MLAKLDNLGPFHFFFTLSCADQRWDENFSSILRKLGKTVIYKTDSDNVEETLILDDKSGETVEMREYLDKHVDASTHELIRRNVFIATRNYNRRVKAFINDIIMDKNNPMCAQYWSTKVEFQGRGAGHNHGVIWVDINKLELAHVDQNGRWVTFDSLSELSGSKGSLKHSLKTVLEEYHVNGNVKDGNDTDICHDIFKKIYEISNDQLVPNDKFIEEFVKKFPLYGISSAFKKFQKTEDLLHHEEIAIINFANKFTTCTLNEAFIASKTEDDELKRTSGKVVDTVKKCYIHAHTKTCKKYSSECRVRIAKFPMWRTILTRPMKDRGEDHEAVKQNTAAS